MEDAVDGKGKLLPTASHLFKLILPLADVANRRGETNRVAPPIVFLLHPSQPLSHVCRLIASGLHSPPDSVEFHSTSPSGRVSQWSDSTDVADFMRDAARAAKFSIAVIYPDDPKETVIDVQVPSFASRTRFLRRRLAVIESQLEGMDKVKRECDHLARHGARRMALGGFGLLVMYWAAVARLTFWDYGWDIMEPITYLSGLSTVICGYLWFLYQGREVSYTSVLDHSISSRREALYRSRGLDIERYADFVAEARSLRREISKIAEDYDRDKWDDVAEDENGDPIDRKDERDVRAKDVGAGDAKDGSDGKDGGAANAKDMGASDAKSVGAGDAKDVGEGDAKDVGAGGAKDVDAGEVHADDFRGSGREAEREEAKAESGEDAEGDRRLKRRRDEDKRRRAGKEREKRDE